MTSTQTNGKPRARREQVSTHLREQFAAAIEAGNPRKARRLLESFLLWDDWGGSDLWDRVRPRQGDDHPGRWVPLSVPSDRRHGSNWPLWRTHQELDELRQESRLRVASNSYAAGLLANLTNNVIGKGYSYKARPQRPVRDANPLKPGVQDPRDLLAEQVQAVIDEFLRQNRWNGQVDPRGCRTVAGSREREIFRRIKRDGECFIRFHVQDGGATLVRFIEPEQVRDGGGALTADGWSFGIQHRMEPFEDVEYPETYSVFWPDPAAKGGEGDEATDQGTFDEIDASEILHLKGPDTDSTVKRGTPAFVYDVGKALDRAARLQRNTSMGAAVRAATAEIWQFATATQAQVIDLASGLAAYTRTDPSTGQQKQVEKIDPGGIRRIPSGQELVQPPEDYSERYLSAAQGDLRQAAAAHCAPEFWVGETSSGNYSNLESAAAPAVRAGQCEQEYYKMALGLCVWRAVLNAAAAGRLPPDVVDQITIDVEAPAVLHRNDLEKAQEDQIAVEVGWKDPQTCAEERGLDWEQVTHRAKEFQKRQQALAPESASGQPGAGASGSPAGLPQATPSRTLGGHSAHMPPQGGGAGARPAPFGQVVREGFDPSEPRDDSGRWTAGAGGDGGAGPDDPEPTAAKAAPTPKPKPKHVARLNRYRQPAVRRRVLHGLRNEGELARAVDGHNLPDSEPADVVQTVSASGELLTDHQQVRDALNHREVAVQTLRRRGASDEAKEAARRVLAQPCVFFEVKTLIVQAAGKIHMSTKAVARKLRWEKRYGAKFVTVAVDDRKGKKHSGNRLYFRAGVGSVKLADMEPMRDFNHILDKVGQL